MHRRAFGTFFDTVRQIRAAYGVVNKRISLSQSTKLGAPVVLGASMSAKMHTRGVTVEKEKEKFLAMTKEDKRSLYRCGTNYTTLGDVKTWSQYQKDLPDKKLKKAESGKYEVNPKLNELVSIWRGDITKLEIDAIVNAANNRLLGGGGVDGAIHAAAGSSLTAECATLNGCETGDAKITLGYKLPASRVIHTVGPIGEDSAKLRSCYKRCLQLVENGELKSVAFPCISTGIYGYPNRNAAEIALEATRKWLEKDDNAEKVERVVFCLFLAVDVDIYEELMQEYFPVAEDAENKSEEESKTGDAVKSSDEAVTSSDDAVTSSDDAVKSSGDEKISADLEKKEVEEVKEKVSSEEDGKVNVGDAVAADAVKETKADEVEKCPSTKL